MNAKKNDKILTHSKQLEDYGEKRKISDNYIILSFVYKSKFHFFFFIHFVKN
jgi:hypothetical protein